MFVSSSSYDNTVIIFSIPIYTARNVIETLCCTLCKYYLFKFAVYQMCNSRTKLLHQGGYIFGNNGGTRSLLRGFHKKISNCFDRGEWRRRNSSVIHVNFSLCDWEISTNRVRLNIVIGIYVICAAVFTHPVIIHYISCL